VVAGQIELLRDRVSTAQSRFQRALELDPRSASALVGIGSILYRQGSFADAQARFRNAYSADRSNLDAVIGIAQASLALNRAGDAKEVIEPAVREHPNDGRLHYWLGKALAATSDQRTLAQQALREAIRLQPENLDAYVSLSELLLAMQRPDAADQVLLEARARVPESAAIHRALAHGRLSRGDLPGAEAELRLAIRREPDDIRSHFALGDVLRRMQRLDDAQAEFDVVGRADANYPGLAMTRGMLAEARGELPQALSTFREALARDPTNAELINRVAATLVALGNFGDADQMLRSVVVDQPTNAEAQYIMGRARLGADNFVDAVHYLDRAVELNPQRSDYKAYAAEAHRRSGDILRALQLAEQSIEIDPTFPRGYWVRAEIRLHRGEAANALTDINRATQLDPRFWAAYATWADVDDALGRRQEAIRLYRFAIEHENRHGDWYYNLGRLLADAGDEGDARGAFAQARALGSGLNPTPTWYAQATRALADIERERHNRSEAQRLYTEYLRLVPQGSPSYNSAALVLSDMLRE
jgi:tetratricopeptide (TPR) repeat protein